ncbi:MAG: CAP domain-containing protein, partial [Lachnospiraceae bacterium]|nr:CAP domain-containing protein [Lachnospiraceae bacterium]
MKKNWKRLVLALTMVLGLALGLVLGLNRLSMVGKADETTTTVELTVTYGQTEAREMLSLINEFRTGEDAWYWDEDDTTVITCSGLSELVYDYNLEAIAMQRAAEIALSCSHTRPNGETWSTIYSEDEYSYVVYTARGENIAAGQTSAQSAFTSWKEEDEDYSGQGHRRNMLSSSYTSIGIGHVIYNGTHYWVQALGKTTTLNTSGTLANDSSTTVAIEVLNSKVSSATLTADPSSYSLVCGDSESLPTLTTSLIMEETWPENTTRTVTVVSPTWVSANKEVATVSESGVVAVSDDDDADAASSSGMVTAVGAGSTTLTVSALGTSTTVPVEVSHSYTAVVTEPTCTEGGHTTYTCSGCDDTYTADKTEATGHSWGEGTVTRAATCTKSGIMTYTCTVCGDTYTEEIAATGHAYGDPVFTWYADYSAEATFTCEVCGQKVVETATVTSDITDATCTEDGATIYTASLTFDGVTYTDKQTVTIAATGHDYDDGVVTTEATCTENGERTYTCSKCGDTYTETIAATGHDYEAVVTEPTCTENGYTTYTCSKCGDSYTTDETDATGHSYDDGAVTTEPTCTEAGERIYTCTACSDTYTETIAATGHRYIEDVLVKVPTCTEVGVKTTTCIICGDVYTTTLAALGHSYNEGEVTTEPTCTEAGEKTYTCASCGDTYTETIPATGHSYVSAVTAPTCTEKGYTTYTCTACGDSYTADETDALGHTWDDGVITKEATEEENGVRTYTCTVCGETKTETIPAITHNFGDPVFTWAEDYSTATATFTCVDEGCGRIIEEAAEVTTATTNPTCTEAGERVYTATVTFDGKTYTDTKAVTLAATGHSYEAIVTAPTCTEKGYTTYTCTVCGDTYT